MNSGRHAPRRRHPSRDELLLWRHAVRDAAPLKGKSANEPEPEESEPPPPASPSPKPVVSPAPPPPKPKKALPVLASGTAVDLDKRSAERLKRGQMAIEGQLDLHGQTQDQAHRALNSFIERAYAMGQRCLIVVTGKGNKPDGSVGVLRTMVPRWLNDTHLRPMILAFSQARPQHGGAGALYVLIKRRRTADT
jgi:DNA-nicking Smr family endonuclease